MNKHNPQTVAPGAMPGPQYLLPPEARQHLLTGEQALQRAATWMDKAERCGIDCGMLREQAREYERQLQGFREQFFSVGESGRDVG